MNANELNKIITSGDEREIYHSIVSESKKGNAEIEHCIVPLLNHTSHNLRSVAIRALLFYLGLEKYLSVAFEMAQNDTNEEVRMVALMSWASYYRGTQKKEVMTELYHILKNKNEAHIVREQAYQSIFSVSGLLPKDWPNTILDDVDTEADWELIDKLIF